MKKVNINVSTKERRRKVSFSSVPVYASVVSVPRENRTQRKRRRKKKCFILTFGLPSLLYLRAVRFHGDLTDIRVLPLAPFTSLSKTKFYVTYFSVKTNHTT